MKSVKWNDEWSAEYVCGLEKQNAALKEKLKIALNFIKTIRATAIINGQEGQDMLVAKINSMLKELGEG